jgi:hypothetical protein
MGRRLKERGLHVPFLASIATTSTTDAYCQADRTGSITGVIIGSLLGLAANDTNYITWSVTNLGAAGAGSGQVLATSDLNTTKATGGVAMPASGKNSLVLNSTAANVAVTEGDTIRIRATVTGTLGAAVTVPRATVIIAANGA